MNLKIEKETQPTAGIYFDAKGKIDFYVYGVIKRANHSGKEVAGHAMHLTEFESKIQEQPLKVPRICMAVYSVQSGKILFFNDKGFAGDELVLMASKSAEHPGLVYLTREEFLAKQDGVPRFVIRGKC